MSIDEIDPNSSMKPNWTKRRHFDVADFADRVLARDGAVNEPSTPSTERPKAGATGRPPRPDASRFLVPPSITLRATPARERLGFWPRYPYPVR